MERIVAVRFQVFHKGDVGKDASLFKTIYVFSDFHIYIAMVHNVVDVVFLNNFIREKVDGYFHIPECIHGIVEVEVLYIRRAEP